MPSGLKATLDPYQNAPPASLKLTAVHIPEADIFVIRPRGQARAVRAKGDANDRSHVPPASTASAPLATSHSRIVLPPPEASRVPSGLKATLKFT